MASLCSFCNNPTTEGGYFFPNGVLGTFACMDDDCVKKFADVTAAAAKAAREQPAEPDMAERIAEMLFTEPDGKVGEVLLNADSSEDYYEHWTIHESMDMADAVRKIRRVLEEG